MAQDDSGESGLPRMYRAMLQRSDGETRHLEPRRPAVYGTAPMPAPYHRIDDQDASRPDGWFRTGDRGRMRDEAMLTAYHRERLAGYEAPRHVRIVTEFPMTATGKIQKYRLHDRAVEDLGLSEAGSTIPDYCSGTSS